MNAEVKRLTVELTVEMIPISDIKPLPANEDLYKPVDVNDPDVQALARSIRENGVRDPLVLTDDYYILSGHRRYAAAQIVRLEEVPCLINPIHSDDPKIPAILAEFNMQRVKTSEEMLREEIVLSSDKETAYCRLRQHRERKASLDRTDCIALVGAKNRHRISKVKTPFLDAIDRVLRDYKKFLPLTDRQIHYALLNNPPLIHASKPSSRYVNDRRCYKSLCELLTRARLEGRIALNVIHDPTRPAIRWKTYDSTKPFLREELKNFLGDYHRNLLQSQPNHIEIVGEKNTIESLIRPVASEFGIPYTIGRGYASLNPRYEMARRYEQSGKEKLILLMLSDFDPEGEDIAHSFAISMRDDFGIENIHPVKVCLTAAQVAEMQLVPQMKAKKGSSRRRRFVDKHGDDVFELEAIPPERLQGILRSAIESVIDTRAFQEEIEREKDDAAFLDTTRNRVISQIRRCEST